MDTSQPSSTPTDEHDIKAPTDDTANAPARRTFLKQAGIGSGMALQTLSKITPTVAVAGALGVASSDTADAFFYEPYPKDDEMTTVVTSCAHNCGSRHMLVAHKKGDTIIRLSTDDGRYQKGGSFGKDTEAEPQLRGCLRGRSYRQRIYSPERLLYPMMRVGERGENKFKRVSWDEALNHVADKMIEIKKKYGPTAILDQSYAGASYGVLHKSDQIEGLLGRFLGMFGCRTNSWSVPSWQGTAFSSRVTYGTMYDGNEDDAFAHSKLIIMWGWNPAYTFHGGNTFYYMRMAKQRGCKFVLVDPQYTDSAGAYDAWWIPIRPNTDAAMMAGMAHYIFANNLQDQKFINKFCQGMDEGTMPEWAKNAPNGGENFKDYILGKYDNTPKTPEWAAKICGVKAEDIIKLAKMYTDTKPAALKASWAPGRNAYGEQYNRMAAALQAMTGNIGKLGGSAEGIGKIWHSESIAYPYDENANLWWASIKSDRWAHCVLNYPNVKREEVGLWERDDELDGKIPNIKAIFWHGSDWFNQLTNINKEIEAIKKIELVVCMDQTITPSGIWADVLLPICTHFERHDAALPWYKGHYYIHRPKVIEPLGESKTDIQVFTELCYRLEERDPLLKDLGKRYNPKADRSYFQSNDKVDEEYLVDWWKKVQHLHHTKMTWEEFKKYGVIKFTYDTPLVAFRDQIEKGEKFETASGKIEIYSTELANIKDFSKTKYGYHIPAIPKWIEPWESLNSPKTAKFPFHLVTPHPRHRTHSIFHQIPWLQEMFTQEVTINASDAKRLGIKTGDVVEVWNERGKIIVPAYVTERVLPGVAVVFEGSWMDIDKASGADRSGNPDFLTLDDPSPAGSFAYNTILVAINKTKLEHRAGWDPKWDRRGSARSSIFRKDS